MNQEIKAPEVRVLDDQNKYVGVMPLVDALRLASEKKVDLIEVGPKGEPPVCKLIEYGKYMYQQEKQQKQTKAKQKQAETKVIRLSIGTSKHDSEMKANQAGKFLEDKNKVRIELQLRGREKMHGDLAKEKVINFMKLIPVEHKMEQEAKKSPSGFFAIVGPKQG